MSPKGSTKSEDLFGNQTVDKNSVELNDAGLCTQKILSPPVSELDLVPDHAGGRKSARIAERRKGGKLSKNFLLFTIIFASFVTALAFPCFRVHKFPQSGVLLVEEGEAFVYSRTVKVHLDFGLNATLEIKNMETLRTMLHETCEFEEIPVENECLNNFKDIFNEINTLEGNLIRAIDEAIEFKLTKEILRSVQTDRQSEVDIDSLFQTKIHQHSTASEIRHRLNDILEKKRSNYERYAKAALLTDDYENYFQYVRSLLGYNEYLRKNFTFLTPAEHGMKRIKMKFFGGLIIALEVPVFSLSDFKLYKIFKMPGKNPTDSVFLAEKEFFLNSENEIFFLNENVQRVNFLDDNSDDNYIIPREEGLRRELSRGCFFRFFYRTNEGFPCKRLTLNSSFTYQKISKTQIIISGTRPEITVNCKNASFKLDDDVDVMEFWENATVKLGLEEISVLEGIAGKPLMFWPEAAVEKKVHSTFDNVLGPAAPRVKNISEGIELHIAKTMESVERELIQVASDARAALNETELFLKENLPSDKKIIEIAKTGLESSKRFANSALNSVQNVVHQVYDFIKGILIAALLIILGVLLFAGFIKLICALAWRLN